MIKKDLRSPELKDAVADLQRLAAKFRVGVALELDDSLRLAEASAIILAAAAGSFGECRKDVPYQPIRPVIPPEGGLRWCCTHDPEHCEPDI